MVEEIRTSNQESLDDQFRRKAEEFSKMIWEPYRVEQRLKQTEEIFCIYHVLSRQQKKVTRKDVANELGIKFGLAKRTSEQVITICGDYLWDYVYYNEEVFNNYSPLPDNNKSLNIFKYLHDYIEQL